MAKIYLSLIIHNHQPCDNFGWVIEDAFKKAYKPFIDVLEKYPDVKIAMHYSGGLFEWIEKHRPLFFQRIKKLVADGQIEILSGGFYEPIMSLLNENDRISQIQQMNSFIESKFGKRPEGFWLAERVWQPDLVTAFKKTGMSYTIVDDNHFKKAGITDDPITGHYMLENGFRFFCGNKTLRYIIPFAQVNEVRDFFLKIRSDKDDVCLVFADDGEKFGFWPKTHKWVYEKKWLEDFFEMLVNNKELVQTVTPSESLKKKESLLLKDMPSASYSEMEQWASGCFENFLLKYPEVDRMHKRMSVVSNRLFAIEQKHDTQRGLVVNARKQLHMAQAGCVYWHGVFGGFYLNHLREGFYKHIISTEKILDTIEPQESVVQTFGGSDIRLNNKDLSIHLNGDKRADIVEIDNRDKALNMINTISRKKEEYHESVKKRSIWKKLDLKKRIEEKKFFNIYDLFGFKSKSLIKSLTYDVGRKSDFIDYFIFGRYSINDMACSSNKNIHELSDAVYQVTSLIEGDTPSVSLRKSEHIKEKEITFDIKKSIGLCAGNGFKVSYEIKNISGKRIKGFFATEVNLSMYNEDLCDQKKFAKVSNLFLTDQWTSSQINIKISEPLQLWVLPIYTINGSEQGMERTYQYLRMLFRKKVCLEKDDLINLNFEIKVK